MANTCTILRGIEKVSQKLADLLSRPLTNGTINKILGQLELLRGSVRDLPLSKKPKRDILNRLAQAQQLLRNGNLNSAINHILAVLAVLQVVITKLNSHRIPCVQGLTLVHPSRPFSTICQTCNS